MLLSTGIVPANSAQGHGIGEDGKVCADFGCHRRRGSSLNVGSQKRKGGCQQNQSQQENKGALKYRCVHKCSSKQYFVFDVDTIHPKLSFAQRKAPTFPPQSSPFPDDSQKPFQPSLFRSRYRHPSEVRCGHRTLHRTQPPDVSWLRKGKCVEGSLRWGTEVVGSVSGRFGYGLYSCRRRHFLVSARK